MNYLIYGDHRISIPPWNGNAILISKGSQLYSKLEEYLKRNNAQLMLGPGELRKDAFSRSTDLNEWVYHIDNTTMYAMIKPSLVTDKLNLEFSFSGKESKELHEDITEIIDELR